MNRVIRKFRPVHLFVILILFILTMIFLSLPSYAQAAFIVISIIAVFCSYVVVATVEDSWTPWRDW